MTKTKELDSYNHVHRLMVFFSRQLESYTWKWTIHDKRSCTHRDLSQTGQDSWFSSKLFFCFKLQYFSWTTNLILKALQSFLARSSLVHSLFSFFLFWEEILSSLAPYTAQAQKYAQKQSWIPTSCFPVPAVRMSPQATLRRGHNSLEGIFKGVGKVQWEKVTGLVRTTSHNKKITDTES